MPTGKHHKDVMFRHTSVKANEEKSNDLTVLVLIPPDGGFAWVIVAAVFLNNFLVDAVLYSFGSYISEIAITLQEPIWVVAFFGSTYIAMFYILSPIAGLLVQRNGFRGTAFLGAAMASVGLFCATLVHNFWWVLLCYGVLGGFGSGCIYAANAMIINYYFERYRGIAAGLAMCGSSAGVGILNPIIIMCVSRYGWHATVRIKAGMLACCAFSSLAFVKFKPTPITVESDETESSIKSTTSTENSPLAIANSHTSKTSSNIVEKFVQNDRQSSSEVTVAEIRRLHPVETMHPNSAVSLRTFSSRYASVIHGKVDNGEHFIKRCFRKACCQTNPLNQTGSITTMRTGPLDRRDIFYSGNLDNISEYKTNFSPIRLPFERVDRDDVEAGCKCPNAIIRMLNTLIDLQLLRSPSFNVMLVSMFFYSLGLFIPYTFLSKFTSANYISNAISGLMVSFLSAGNMVGRISAGLLSLIPQTIPEYMNGIMLMLAGLLTLIDVLWLENNETVQIAYVVFWGMCVGFNPPLRPVIFVRYLGLGKLPKCYAMIRVVMGMAALFGTPFAGLLMERTGSYRAAFLFSGACLCVSGLESVFLKWVRILDLRERDRGHSVLANV